MEGWHQLGYIKGFLKIKYLTRITVSMTLTVK